MARRLPGLGLHSSTASLRHLLWGHDLHLGSGYSHIAPEYSVLGFAHGKPSQGARTTAIRGDDENKISEKYDIATLLADGIGSRKISWQARAAALYARRRKICLIINNGYASRQAV